MTEQSYSDEQAQRLALAAAKEAVREALTEVFAVMGINIANFEAMEAFRADLSFVRSLRHGANKAGSRFALTIVSVVAGAVAIGTWEWFKSLLHP